MNLYRFELSKKDKIVGLVIAAARPTEALGIAFDWVGAWFDSDPNLCLLGKADTTQRQGVVSGYTRALEDELESLPV